MYQGIESAIDPIKERNAILKFLNRYWDVRTKRNKSLADANDYILQEGIRYGIALYEKEYNETTEVYNELMEMRNAREGKKSKKIDFQRTTIDDDLKGNFPSRIDLIETTIKREFIMSAMPKKYKSFKYRDDDDEELEFDGTKELHYIAGGAVCFNFPTSLKSRHIHYSEENQERSPLTELVSAIYRQGMNIGVQAVAQKYGTWVDFRNKIRAEVLGTTD